MDVFILAGQSNMAGRGGVQRLPDGRTSFACSKESSAVTTIGRLLSFDERQGWQPAIEPIHVNVDNRKTCGYGPGPFFGELLLKRGLASKVGLIPCAVGGTSMTEWREGGHLFQQMVSLTEKAMDSCREASLKAVLWYQGESDCLAEEDAEAWPSKFEAFVQATRRCLMNTYLHRLPFIMVVVTCKSRHTRHADVLRQNQKDLSMPDLFKVDAEGLELQADGLHLTTAAQQILGAYLAKMYGNIACKT